MKKLIMAALLLGVVCVSKSEAGVGKSMYASKYVTTITSVTTSDSVLYGVIMSTGAATDYVNFYDSGNVTNLAATYVSSAPFVFQLRYSSAATMGLPGSIFYSFTPPLQFNNGIAIAPSTAGEGLTLIYEGGRP